MNISSFILADIHYIHHLQPEGWLPITPYYQFYTTADFCSPVKCVYGNKIVGIGTAILHETTGWLAHIIVDKEFRNRGIGTLITQSLMEKLSPSVKTMLLIATPLGEPVYHKLGFEKETAYIFLRNGKTNESQGNVIQKFEGRHKDKILKLDQQVSGENRIKILEPHFPNTFIVVERDEVTGFFMPALGEGLIIATTKSAGEHLLNMKHSSSSLASVPIENEIAIKFLLANGFVEFRKAIRMWYGEKISWQPDKLFGRIGGNLG